ncbi:ORF6C domain-containing protein [Clostridium sp. HBUAS56010]|uniref:ORF6C domain-containing protein n=1 Tax=Clostridium sp. HBUAS56010 TaxID=2571127 RepID=UPI001177D056|nr:ORF6C domain-containing protein [Clostridium sp. HBUAS56010]
MGKELEKRMSKLELLTKRLGESSQITNEVVTELTSELSGIVREQVKEEMVTREREIESNVITTVKDTVESTIREKLDERGLSKIDADRLTKARQKRMRELLGNPSSDEYQLFIGFYQGKLRNGYKRKFDVTTYAGIDPSIFKEALEYIQNFDMANRSWCINALHRTYQNNEFANNKLVHAYERFFGIEVA